MNIKYTDFLFSALQHPKNIYYQVWNNSACSSSILSFSRTKAELCDKACLHRQQGFSA